MTSNSVRVKMPVNEEFIDVIERNYRITRRQVSDLTHEESLIQPPYFGNCLNWVLGHMVQSRDRILKLLDLPSVWTPEQNERYRRDSAPVTIGDDAMRFEEILAAFDATKQRIVTKLKEMSDESFEAIKEMIPGSDPSSVADWLRFFLWHETYHVGQTDILRQVAGKNDKVI